MSSSYEHKSYHRNNKGDNDNSGHKSSSKDVSGEVRKLIASGQNDYSVLTKLRTKYSNDQDMVDAVYDGYKDRLEYISKKARKFKQLMFDRYSRHNITYPQLIKKARKYKAKYELNEDEFALFLSSALNDKTFNGSMPLPNTAMSKTLGPGPSVYTQEKLNVKDNEIDVLQDILRIHGETKTLHASVVVQALTYRDCAAEAITGTFKSDRHNPYSYVHPIIAALFLPKINLLDELMLIANMANIVKSNHEGTIIKTKPEYELYGFHVTDPNDTVCDMSSPMKDLKNRIVLQTRLWDSVRNLRSGQYYNERLNEFLVAVDNCRNNIYDMPDLTYVKDEGAIVRRLLCAFSLRPTIVSLTPLFGLVSNNPHINPTAITQVTTVPMITLRLPLNTSSNTTSINLNVATQQGHWFVENKMVVPKSQSILYSRDVLFFYVGRRFQMINIANLSHPFNFSALPMTVSGFERLNDRLVDFDMNMTINEDEYTLRSVVFVERSKTNNNLIIGSTAGIRIPTDLSAGKYGETYLLYDPQGAAEYFDSGAGYKRNNPVTSIPGTRSASGPAGTESFYERASTRGTVFVYAKKTDKMSRFFHPHGLP